MAFAYVLLQRELFLNDEPANPPSSASPRFREAGGWPGRVQLPSEMSGGLSDSGGVWRVFPGGCECKHPLRVARGRDVIDFEFVPGIGARVIWALPAARYVKRASAGGRSGGRGERAKGGGGEDESGSRARRPSIG